MKALIAASWAALLCLVVWVAPVQAKNLGLYLFRIATESQGVSDNISLSGQQEFSLYTEKAPQLEKNLRQSSLKVTSQGEGYIQLQSRETDVFSAPPTPAHLQSSFIIDFEEADVVQMIEAVELAHGKAPTIDELVVFVDKTISTKTLKRGFDFASEVAKRKEGDCTEHAVLLTALARAFNRPARVVFGLLVLSDGNRVETAGHAWAEIHTNSTWQIADATRPALAFPDQQHRHVPLSFIENESPAYRMGLLTAQSVFPQKVIHAPK